MEKSMEIKSKNMLHTTGLLFLVVLAFCSAFLAMRMVSQPAAETNDLFHAGMDVLGAFVCAALYYGCMGDRNEKVEDSTRYFVWMIVQVSLGFLSNEFIWYFDGRPDMRFAQLLANVISSCVDLTLVFCFWRYVYNAFDVKGKTAENTDRVIKILLVPALILMLMNLVRPVGFGVDESGAYYETNMNWTSAAYMVIVAAMTAVLLIRSGASLQEKAAGLSFIAIPVLAYALTLGKTRLATQYGAILVSLVLMYSILYAARRRKLATTQAELDTAAQIQKAVLPNIYPAFPDRPEFDLFASMDPAREVGGDFYDFFLVDDDHLCIIIADVSGKGVPAALYMMASKIMLDGNAQMGKSPAEILTETNEALCHDNREDMFVTVWIGMLTISTGRLVAANAGHEFPVIKYGSGPYELYRDTHGFVVGGMEGLKYQEYELTLTPGSRIFLYTDGVPEATNRNDEMFGTGRMIEALNMEKEAGPEKVLKNVRLSVDGFVADAEQFDDLTMLCLEYKGGAER